MDNPDHQKSELVGFLYRHDSGDRHYKFLSAALKSRAELLLCFVSLLIVVLSFIVFVLGVSGFVLLLAMKLKSYYGGGFYIPFEDLLEDNSYLPFKICISSLFLFLMGKVLNNTFHRLCDQKMAVCKRAAAKLLAGDFSDPSLGLLGIKTPHNLLFAFHVEQSNSDEFKKLKNLVADNLTMRAFLHTDVVRFHHASPTAVEASKELWSWFTSKQKIQVSEFIQSKYKVSPHALNTSPAVKEFLCEAQCLKDKIALEKNLGHNLSSAPNKIRKM